MADIVDNTTAAITSALSDLPSPKDIDEASRMKLLAAMDSLRAALEPPMISLQRLCFSVRTVARRLWRC